MFGKSRYILKINPKSGEVLARIDFSEIVKKHNTGTDDVLNGIAFKGQNMLVTGKIGTKFMK
jgi:glutamine cyclotransferase